MSHVHVSSCIRNELSHKIMPIICNTLFLLYVSYCCIIWGFTYSSYSNTFPYSALHIISNLPTYCNTSPIVMNIGIRNVCQLIFIHDLLLILQQQNNLLSNLSQCAFIMRNEHHTYNTSNFQYQIKTFTIKYIYELYLWPGC